MLKYTNKIAILSFSFSNRKSSKQHLGNKCCLNVDFWIIGKNRCFFWLLGCKNILKTHRDPFDWNIAWFRQKTRFRPKSEQNQLHSLRIFYIKIQILVCGSRMKQTTWIPITQSLKKYNFTFQVKSLHVTKCICKWNFWK